MMRYLDRIVKGGRAGRRCYLASGKLLCSFIGVLAIVVGEVCFVQPLKAQWVEVGVGGCKENVDLLKVENWGTFFLCQGILYHRDELTGSVDSLTMIPESKFDFQPWEENRVRWSAAAKSRLADADTLDMHFTYRPRGHYSDWYRLQLYRDGSHRWSQEALGIYEEHVSSVMSDDVDYGYVWLSTDSMMTLRGRFSERQSAEGVRRIGKVVDLDLALNQSGWDSLLDSLVKQDSRVRFSSLGKDTAWFLMYSNTVTVFVVRRDSITYDLFVKQFDSSVLKVAVDNDKVYIGLSDGRLLSHPLGNLMKDVGVN